MKLVVVSDTHVNSTIGLFPPKFKRDDGGTVTQNKFQAWLWRQWLDFAEHANSLGEYTLIINGDAVQGIHPSKDSQVVVPSRLDMLRAAVDVFRVFRPSKILMTRGTPFHDGTDGTDAEDLAERLKATKSEDTGQYSRFFTKVRLDGKSFWFAHQAAKHWRDIKDYAVDYEGEVPDCIVRSHVHSWDVTPDRVGRLFFSTPGWQLTNSFGYKNRPFVPPDIGGLVLWVEDGEIKWKRKLYLIPSQRPVSL